MMEMLSYEFMQRAFLAGLIVALLCPLVGMFVVIRRQSLLGDGLGHIAFAGVTGSALLGINPAIGAVVLTLAAAGGIEIVRRKHLQYGDMGLALFFYGGLALAVVCSSLARIPNTSLMSFLFGSILTVNWANIAAIAGQFSAGYRTYARDSFGTHEYVFRLAGGGGRSDRHVDCRYFAGECAHDCTGCGGAFVAARI